MTNAGEDKVRFGMVVPTSDGGNVAVGFGAPQGIALVLMAADYAAKRHRLQRRKGEDEDPYINHPLGLAAVLAVEGNVSDPNVLAAAVLHDVLEDTVPADPSEPEAFAEARATLEAELKTTFGATICEIVRQVTDDKLLPKQQRKELQIEHAKQASKEAKLVKLADKICNLREILDSPPTDWSKERKREYFDWAKKVVDGIRGTNVNLEAAFDAVYGRLDSK